MRKSGLSWRSSYFWRQHTPRGVAGVTILFVSDAHVSVQKQQGTISQYARFVDKANRLAPNAVIDLGDAVYDGGNDPTAQALWKSEWDRISCPKKELVLGNHDSLQGETLPFTSMYDELVQVMGYEGRDEVAGSKMQRSFKVSVGNVAVRIITLDTNMDANLEHQIIWDGTIQQPSRDWLAHELATCPENTVVLCSHHSPHQYQIPSRFTESHAIAMQNIVNDALVSRPELKVMHFSGHHHVGPLEYFTLGERYPGIIVPSLFENEKIVRLRIYQERIVYDVLSV